MLPKFPDYKKDSLRPNPQTADPEAPVRFGQETQFIGDFGSWDASPTLVNGLPPARNPAKGEGTGWPPQSGDQMEHRPR